MLFQLCNELIQVKDGGIKYYFSNSWNINDGLMIMINLLYSALRIGTENFQKNFVLIKNFEFTEDHLEEEI